MMITGCDEAGRGPLIGPLVVAGVTFKDEKKLVDNRIRDSKLINPKRREILAEFIKKKAVKYEIIKIPAADIDDLRRLMTLNDIEVNAFAKIIEILHPSICYVDSADVKAVRFKESILEKVSYIPDIISEHKADVKYPIVGAASILAKITRDNEIRLIADKLEIAAGVPLGSGYPADVVTQRFLDTWVKKYGKLPPHCRKSWKTSLNILKKHKIKKLDDF